MNHNSGVKPQNPHSGAKDEYDPKSYKKMAEF